MIKAEVTFEGTRSNADGEMWLKYEVPQSELSNIAPFLFLVDVKLHMAIDIAGERHYAGHAQSNNLTRRPTGDAVITLRGMHENVKHGILDMLPGKSFTLMLLTELELQQLLSDDTPVTTGVTDTGHADLVGVSYAETEQDDIAL